MDLFTKNRIGNILKLILFVALTTILIVFREQFLDSIFNDTSPFWLSLLFVIAIGIAIISLIGFTINDLFKSRKKFIKENKIILNNRIKQHENAILLLKKEIEKYG
jgi:ABC-type multidrug transport system fused ATPase/permease subunit